MFRTVVVEHCADLQNKPNACMYPSAYDNIMTYYINSKIVVQKSSKTSRRIALVKLGVITSATNVNKVVFANSDG